MGFQTLCLDSSIIGGEIDEGSSLERGSQAIFELHNMTIPYLFPAMAREPSAILPLLLGCAVH